jgi:hypothetical protein
MVSNAREISFILCFLCLSPVHTRSQPNPTISAEQKAAVFVSLAPACPLSQSCTLTLNNLPKDLEPKGIPFYGVFPGEAISRNAMDDFVATYHVGFPVMLDPEAKIADFLGATSTPEALLADSSGHTLHKGPIDNWAPELGQHRHHATLLI